MRGRPGWLKVAAAGLAAALALPALAAGEERFQVRNAYVELAAGVWQLHARLDLSLATAANEALDEGVPLTLELDVEALNERRFLPDEQVASLNQRWQLEYDAIADRYVVSNLNSGEQTTHATRPDALEALSRISALPLADEALLQPGRRHELRVRATVAIGGLPEAVKLLLFWRDWSRTTDWYSWSVRP